MTDESPVGESEGPQRFVDSAITSGAWVDVTTVGPGSLVALDDEVSRRELLGILSNPAVIRGIELDESIRFVDDLQEAIESELVDGQQTWLVLAGGITALTAAVVGRDGSVRFVQGCGVEFASQWTASFAELAAVGRRAFPDLLSGTDADVLDALIGEDDLVRDIQRVMDEEEHAADVLDYDDFSDEDRPLSVVVLPEELVGVIDSIPAEVVVPEAWVTPGEQMVLCSRLELGWGGCSPIVDSRITLVPWIGLRDERPVALYVGASTDDLASLRPIGEVTSSALREQFESSGRAPVIDITQTGQRNATLAELLDSRGTDIASLVQITIR